MGLKELFHQAKQKVKLTLDKGNQELKKYTSASSMILYSKPVFGGFVSKPVFLIEGELLIPIEDIKEDVNIHTLFKLKEDDEVYVVTEMDTHERVQEIIEEEKHFIYKCYTVKYRNLNDIFTEETMHMSYQELSSAQQEVLNHILDEIKQKPLAVASKKEACLKLWQYFTECIEYGLKDHYVMETFVKIADDYVPDFSAYLLKLFA